MAIAQSPYGEQQTQVGAAPTPTPAKKPLATGAPTDATKTSGSLSLAAPTDPYATLADASGDGNYLGKTIQPGPQTDRLSLAANAWDTFAKRTDPVYQKTIRDAEGAAAATGRLGSGQLRTSLGDAASQRQLQLDTARDAFINEAIGDSIGDYYKNIEIAQQQQGFQAGQQQTAYAQALAKAQQELSAELGRGNLGVQKGQLDLAKTGQEGSLALQQKALQLDEMVRTGQMTLAEKDQKLRELQNEQQYGLAGEQIQLAKDQFALSKQLGLENLTLDQASAALDEKVRTGQLTLAEKDQALRELANEQANKRADDQLSLAKGEALGKVQTGVDEAGNPIYEETQNAKQAANQLALQQKALELDEKVRTGQMTLAEKDQALRELAQSQGNANEQARLQLAKDQLAQEAERFGASQAQQLELAKLADATANRQIDVNTTQGRNQLLVTVANILGGASGAVPPDLLRAVLAALGVTYTPTTGGTGGYGGTGGTTGTGTTGGTGSGSGTTTTGPGGQYE